jgi:methyl-accepting chemotaxis protein
MEWRRRRGFRDGAYANVKVRTGFRLQKSPCPGALADRSRIVWMTSHVNDNVIDLGTNWMLSVKLLGDMRGTGSDVCRTWLSHVLAPDADAKNKLDASYDVNLKEKLPAIMAACEKAISPAQEERLYETIESTWQAGAEADRKTIELSNGGYATFNDARAQAAGPARDAFTAFASALVDDIRDNTEGAAAAMAAAAGTYRNGLILDAITRFIVGPRGRSAARSNWPTPSRAVI